MAGGIIDRILNVVVPILALLFFGAVMYRNQAIKEVVDLIGGWFKSIFERMRGKKEELEDEGDEYFYLPK